MLALASRSLDVDDAPASPLDRATMDITRVKEASYLLQAIRCWVSYLPCCAMHEEHFCQIENLSSQPWLILSNDHYTLTFHLISVSTLLCEPDINNPEWICPRILPHLKNLRRKYSLISGPRKSCQKEGCLKSHEKMCLKSFLSEEICFWSPLQIPGMEIYLSISILWSAPPLLLVMSVNAYAIRLRIISYSMIHCIREV